MKLIAEYTEQNIECLVEAKEDGSKNYTIEGVFAQAEQKNRNGRIYPKMIMENAVKKYAKEQVATKRAVGELNHPEGPTVNLDKVSHLITDLKVEDNNVMGKARILDTPMGQVVKGLLEGGVQLGVSTRGMGSLENVATPCMSKMTLCLIRLTSYKIHQLPELLLMELWKALTGSGIMASLKLKKLKKWRLKLKQLHVLISMRLRLVSIRISSRY
jgi:hypothetical protein